MSIEFEIKLALPLNMKNARIERALEGIPGLSTGRWSDHLQENTYYDSENGSVHRGRIALRHRRVDGRNVVTVKTPATDGTARHEWECDFDGDSLRDALAKLPIEMELPAVKQVISGETGLIPIAATDYLRRRCEAVYMGTTAEIAIDRGVLSRGALSRTFAEMEIELIEGDQQQVRALAEEIRQRLSLRYEARGKLSRAMHLRAVAPRTKS